ncbi:intradiol ring-cleavage dioxygenase [Fulvivirga ligni]|uniref:intradiol ring-cleavage dioxygenase n=1 Tax=Fulvivirga ligni TaxID=2904246 RepID=UPI001F191A22|nr:intradiol ring-cleavage dioxygenase [Fulvivirga ligni]UII20514.1 intradiol ring-cleavage dioxygenase [Fulvivirga ligni]
MKLFLLAMSFIIAQSIVHAQSKQVGGPCEDCEALMDYKILNPSPQAVDTLPGFMDNDPKIKIKGTVFHKDGKTPANGVILYLYHVSRKGYYEPSANPKGWEIRHGQYRGWLKTGRDGKFTFYTFRPAAYPKAQEPEHIHIYLKEPGTVPYYIDSYLFNSDPLLTKQERLSQENRGGSGIIKLTMEDDIWTAHRDIILGLNIPGYE